MFNHWVLGETSFRDIVRTREKCRNPARSEKDHLHLCSRSMCRTIIISLSLFINIGYSYIKWLPELPSIQVVHCPSNDWWGTFRAQVILLILWTHLLYLFFKTEFPSQHQQWSGSETRTTALCIARQARSYEATAAQWCETWQGVSVGFGGYNICGMNVRFKPF